MKGTTVYEDRQMVRFINENYRMSLEDGAIEDGTNMDPLIEWINMNLKPETVFDFNQLDEWALNNGYIKEEDCE